MEMDRRWVGVRGVGRLSQVGVDFAGWVIGVDLSGRKSGLESGEDVSLVRIL